MARRVCVNCDRGDLDEGIKVDQRDVGVYDGTGTVIGRAHVPVCDACYVSDLCLIQNDEGAFAPFLQNPK